MSLLPLPPRWYQPPPYPGTDVPMYRWGTIEGPGNKGQELPTGVLPEGLRKTGPPQEMAQRNKRAAEAMNAQAEENLLEAKEEGEELERQGLATDSKVSTTPSVREEKP